MLSCCTRMLAATTILFGMLNSAAVGQRPTSLPTPPNAVRLLMIESEQSLADSDFGGAVDALQQLLDLQEDYFDPGAEGRSIKQHAERTLRLLPGEGLQAYERRYGPEAATLLDEARRAGDDETLNEVIRRYAMTDAGAVAVELLAARLWDSGALLAAGRLFDRLLDHPSIDDLERATVLVRSAVCWWGCGNTSRARDRLAAWSRLAEASSEVSGGQFPFTTVDVNAVMDSLAAASRQVPVAPRDTGERITSFRGDVQRSGVLDRATPTGGVVWSYPAIDENDSWEEGRIAEVADKFADLESEILTRAGEEHSVLPSGMPVIAGNRVVFRGYAGLKWVNPGSGEFICFGADRDQSFVNLVERDWRPADDWHRRHLHLLFGQRGWRDATCGTLSCDDRYVYSIFNSGIVSAMGPTVQNIESVATHPLAPRSYNSLAAYEVELGRFIWEQGGPPRPGNDILTGVYFLGPPLPLDGLLYCLVDDRKQVRLVVIDPALDPLTEDEIVWEQPLYNAENHLSSPAAEGRRLSGTDAVSLRRCADLPDRRDIAGRRGPPNTSSPVDIPVSRTLSGSTNATFCRSHGTTTRR